MSVRELLESAAKAAGIEVFGLYGDDDDECQYQDEQARYSKVFSECSTAKSA